MKRNHHSECGGCGTEERWLLHDVRHRSCYRRLCTNCLLKIHQGFFCPFCFHVYEEPLPPEDLLLCMKCPSISHLSCAPASNPPSFLCPTCSSPNISFFNLTATTLTPTATTDNDSRRTIDKDSARALVAAAKIAAVSMTKAAAVARVEAERRVREAAVAKKRAREALERLTYLAAKDREIAAHKLNHKQLTSNGNGTTVAVRGEKGNNGVYTISVPTAANAVAQPQRK